MKFGIIYDLVKTIVNIFHYLNFVELLKKIVAYFSKSPKDEINNIQITIDIFILLKFSFVLLIWKWKLTTGTIELVIWYLILSNIFTYFYYHVWVPPFQINNDSQRRRFINLMISVLFSNLCFAVLYAEFYFEYFKLKDGHYKELSSLMMSNFNSIFGNYDPLKPKSDYGYFINLIQLGISFLFLSIILSVSVPQLKKEEKNGVQQ